MKNGAKSWQQYNAFWEIHDYSALSLAIREKNNEILDILLENAIDEYSVNGEWSWDKNHLLAYIYRQYIDYELSETDKMEKNKKYLKVRLDKLLEKQLKRKTSAKKFKAVGLPPDIEKEVFSYINGGKTKKKTL